MSKFADLVWEYHEAYWDPNVFWGGKKNPHGGSPRTWTVCLYRINRDDQTNGIRWNPPYGSGTQNHAEEKFIDDFFGLLRKNVDVKMVELVISWSPCYHGCWSRLKELAMLFPDINFHIYYFDFYQVEMGTFNGKKQYPNLATYQYQGVLHHGERGRNRFKPVLQKTPDNLITLQFREALEFPYGNLKLLWLDSRFTQRQTVQMLFPS